MGIMDKFFKEGVRYSTKDGSRKEYFLKLNDSIVELRDIENNRLETIEVDDRIKQTRHYNNKGELTKIGYYYDYLDRLEINNLDNINIKEVIERENNTIQTRDYYGIRPNTISDRIYDEEEEDDDEWDDWD